MIIDRRLAGKLLVQWGRWASQSGSIARESAKETGQLNAPSKASTSSEYNEPLMALIDGILRSNRLTERQKTIARLEWKFVWIRDQEQGKRKYNQWNQRNVITIDQYKKSVRSIKSIVADGVKHNQRMLIRDTIAMKKHIEKYIDKNTGNRHYWSQ